MHNESHNLYKNAWECSVNRVQNRTSSTKKKIYNKLKIISEQFEMNPKYVMMYGVILRPCPRYAEHSATTVLIDGPNSEMITLPFLELRQCDGHGQQHCLDVAHMTPGIS